MGRRRGFTIVEVVIALLVGTILTSIALSSFAGARAGFAVKGARNTFASLEARARAKAIESGSTILLMVDVSGDSAYVSTGASTVETVRFAGEFHVDLRSGIGNFRLCMNSRGYADTDCNSFSGSVNLEFWQNSDSATVTVLPLGQLVY
jgi:prepilin-type N-terminal cleavage/methylation domain-containing protein